MTTMSGHGAFMEEKLLYHFIYLCLLEIIFERGLIAMMPKITRYTATVMRMGSTKNDDKTRVNSEEKLTHTVSLSLLPFPPLSSLYTLLSLLLKSNQWQTSVYCLFCARSSALAPAPPITEMFLPISAFTYHFPGDIELPMPRPLRHISELTQLLFIPTNNLVMKY